MSSILKAVSAGRAISEPLVEEPPEQRPDQQAKLHAIINARRFAIAPPGLLPLFERRFTLVDVPDLTVLPRQFPSLKTVWVGAGTLPAVLHRAGIQASRARARHPPFDTFRYPTSSGVSATSDRLAHQAARTRAHGGDG